MKEEVKRFKEQFESEGFNKQDLNEVLSTLFDYISLLEINPYKKILEDFKEYISLDLLERAQQNYNLKNAKRIIKDLKRFEQKHLEGKEE